MRPATLTYLARNDIQEILAWSLSHFGRTAALRYRNLIIQALLDIASDPFRPGNKERPEIAPGIRTYHLVMSRGRTASESVKSPRHFILYRWSKERVEVLRVLHDSRDLHPDVISA